MQGRYRAASGLGGRMPWRVVYEGEECRAAGFPHFELCGPRARVVLRFRTYESARRRAEAWNRKGAAPSGGGIFRQPPA